MSDKFNQDYLNHYTNTDIFKEEIQDMIFFHLQGDRDFEEYEASSDYKRLTLKFQKDKGVYIDLPDKKAEYYFTTFNSEQLFYILYAYWYGLSEKQINFFAKPTWSKESMALIIDLYTLLKVPDEEIFLNFSHNCSYKKWLKLSKG